MAGYAASNPNELKDVILRRLGAPVINVEVTTEQVFDCISRAIELFIDYHPDGLNRTFLTVNLSETQAANGIIHLDKPIYSVTKVLRAGSNFWTMDGTSTYTWFSDFIRGLSGVGIPGSCNSYHGGLMANGDLSTYYMFMQYQNTMLDLLQPIQDFWYNAVSNTIRVIGNVQPGDLIVMEAWAPSAMLVADSATGVVGNEKWIVGSNDTPDDDAIWDDPYQSLKTGQYVGNPQLYAEQGVYNVRWVKDYATALTRQLQGLILSRHQGMNLPGGVSIDGQSIYQQATDEIARLRDELLQLSEPLPILFG